MGNEYQKSEASLTDRAIDLYIAAERELIGKEKTMTEPARDDDKEGEPSAQEIVNFLLGEGPLFGLMFGDDMPGAGGRFWWRRHLREAVAREGVAARSAIGTSGLRTIIADDGYAITFQTMGQYRTALLKAADGVAGAESKPVAWMFSNEEGDEDFGNNWQAMKDRYYCGGPVVPLFTAPPSSTKRAVLSRPLTDEELDRALVTGEILSDDLKKIVIQAKEANALRAARPYMGAPDGWQLVPKKASTEMQMAAFSCLKGVNLQAAAPTKMGQALYKHRRRWIAMLEAAPTPPSATAATNAATDVLAERQRQKAVEGWDEGHDDEHDIGEMASAGGSYAIYAGLQARGMVPDADTMRGSSPDTWPWDEQWWKPKDQRRNLVRAAALLLAEIERLDRAAPTEIQR